MNDLNLLRGQMTQTHHKRKLILKRNKITSKNEVD